MNIKGTPVTLVTRAKAAAILRDQTLTQWVNEAMESKLLEAPNGNVEGISESSIGQDHGETESTSWNGTGIVSKVDNSGGGIPKRRSRLSSVSRVRRRDQDATGAEGLGGSVGLSAVLGSHDEAQPKSGSVGGSAPKNPASNGHPKNCRCPKCR